MEPANLRQRAEDFARLAMSSPDRWVREALLEASTRLLEEADLLERQKKWRSGNRSDDVGGFQPMP
jgi:hypothetical protein